MFVEPGNALYFDLFSQWGTCPALNFNGTGAMPSAVPEPATAWMWAAAGPLGWWRLRRRSR